MSRVELWFMTTKEGTKKMRHEELRREIDVRPPKIANTLNKTCQLKDLNASNRTTTTTTIIYRSVRL